MISDDQAKQNISSNIRRLLAERGWSQADLARKVRIDNESQITAEMRVSRYIHAKQIASAASLARIAEAFDVSADYLLSPHRKKIRKSG